MSVTRMVAPMSARIASHSVSHPGKTARMAIVLITKEKVIFCLITAK
ncbi:MAG: hypothetical protein H6Q73_3972, partial [Firmicutes bacterium]|nr:hypothetical protein [Bacillota bacterium]